MAKGIYVGVGGVPKKSKVYVGVGGVKKVKKGFIGIGGLPKLMFSSEVVYVGQTTPLTVARGFHASANTTNHLLFAGGRTDWRSSSPVYIVTTVDAYNSNLVSTTTNLSRGKQSHGGCSVGQYAVFTSGMYDTAQYNMDAFNASLVRSTPVDLTVAEGISYERSTAKAGENVMVVKTLNAVVSYSTSLVKTSVIDNASRYGWTGASVGEYAIFTDGIYSSNIAASDNSFHVYNQSLVKTSVPDVSYSYNRHTSSSGASNKNYAVFYGGCNPEWSSYYSGITALSATLVTTGIQTHSFNDDATSRAFMSEVSTPDCAIFAGGRKYEGPANNIELFDTTLVRRRDINLVQARYDAKGGYIGGKVLVTGGINGTTVYDTAELLEV